MEFLDIEINESMAKKVMIIVVVLIFIYALINLISYSFLSQYTLGPETITNDEISFSVHLNQGETYASVINIVNNGNVNEKLTQLKMTELSPELASKVDFHLSYEGEDYIGSSYGINDVIGRGQGARKQLFITVNAKESVDLDLAAELVFAFEAK